MFYLTTHSTHWGGKVSRVLVFLVGLFQESSRINWGRGGKVSKLLVFLVGLFQESSRINWRRDGKVSRVLMFCRGRVESYQGCLCWYTCSRKVPEVIRGRVERYQGCLCF